MGLNISLNGLDSLKKELNNLPKVLDTQLNTFTKSIANEILEEAKRLCPVASGHLRDSGYIQFKDKGFVVGFGAEYAVYVHENMSAKHLVGQAKFLDDAVIKVRSKYKL